MAFIRTVPVDAATGLLKKAYDAARERAGLVFQVIQIQSVRPHVLQASTRLYTELMQSARSPLSRAQREMIATAVSQVNGCAY